MEKQEPRIQNQESRSENRVVRDLMARHETDALAVAIAASDWDRAALLVALGMHMAARLMPPATIDDVLALLAQEVVDDGS